MAEGTLDRRIDRGFGFHRTPEERDSREASGTPHPTMTPSKAPLPKGPRSGKAPIAPSSDVQASAAPASAAPASAADDHGPAYHDPTWVIQCAWSVFRLARLQELIRLTIVDLQSLPRPEPLDDELAAHRLQRDPVAEALKACCEELRDASGMGGAGRAQHCELVRAYMQQQPAAWSESFAEALDKYRRAATLALESAFARAAIV